MSIKNASFEKIINELESSGDFKVLKRVKSPVLGDLDSNKTYKIGIVLDVETTGLDFEKDEIIELGIVKFKYDENGIMKGPIDEFQGFNESSKPISNEITEITGIKNTMVKGQHIDEAEVTKFLSNVDLVVAHNASFDRPFCEGKWPIFQEKAWACSINDINWKEEGIKNLSLDAILNTYKHYHEGHRAIEDCLAVVNLLSWDLPKSRDKVLYNLLNNAHKSTVKIWAENAPFDKKGVLKSRGYKWFEGSKDRKKSWWVEVEEKNYKDEVFFLRENIYFSEINFPNKKISAYNRYSKS